jgi:type II secretion system protein N
MLSFKAIIGYLAFALAAVVFFLYVLFPERAVRTYLENRLAAIDPQLELTIGTIRPSIPPGLDMRELTIAQDDQRLIRVDSVRVRPELMSLWTSDTQLRFQAQLAGGSVTGRATAAGGGTGGLSQMEADLADIRIEEIDAVKRIERFTPIGILKGHITQGEGRSADQINGLLTTSDLRINLAQPLFGIADIQVATSNTEFTMAGGTLRIKSLTFDGPMVEGRIGGTIDIRYPMAQSRLNLTGNAKPQPNLFARLQETVPQGLLNPRTLGTRGLTFRVRGSLGSPDLSTR